jgi:tRNA nucleotidyltransferase (CCA-adding enzyme)
MKTAPQMHSRWEQFPHQADVGVRGIGATKAEAFEQAALALIGVICDPTGVRSETEVRVTCEAPDDELLLVEWLNAVVYEISTRRMLFGKFHVSIEDGTLHAVLSGENIELSRHQPAVEVKGATCTELFVGRNQEKVWIAQCVVDV